MLRCNAGFFDFGRKGVVEISNRCTVIVVIIYIYVFFCYFFQVREPPELGRAGHDPVRVGQRVAVLDQNGPVPGQFRTGRHRQPEGRGPADGRRPDGAGHHAGRPSEKNYEQHTGHAGAVFGQPVRGLSGLIVQREPTRAFRVAGPRRRLSQTFGSYIYIIVDNIYIT